MIFEKRVNIIRKTLFKEYEITEKILESDWQDESTELALLVSVFNDRESVSEKYSNYLVERFKDDDFTDFKSIGYKLFDEITN